MKNHLPFAIQPQPTETSCGPTCLAAAYAYYDDPVPLEQLIAEVPELASGGTLAVNLATHALRRGYGATIYTYNLQLFDPTWFSQDRAVLRSRLKLQAAARTDPKQRLASQAYLEFFDLGGKIRYEDLEPALVRRFLRRGQPILTGLSATFLYRESRELANGAEDDINGEPSGHFVVLCGYHKGRRTVLVADPYDTNPMADSRIYEAPMARVLGAILLGVITYDANLLILEPPRAAKRSKSR